MKDRCMMAERIVRKMKKVAGLEVEWTYKYVPSVYHFDRTHGPTVSCRIDFPHCIFDDGYEYFTYSLEKFVAARKRYFSREKAFREALIER